MQNALGRERALIKCHAGNQGPDRFDRDLFYGIGKAVYFGGVAAAG